MKRTAAVLVLVFIFSLPTAPPAYSKIVVFTGGTVIEFPDFVSSGCGRIGVAARNGGDGISAAGGRNTIGIPVDAVTGKISGGYLFAQPLGGGIAGCGFSRRPAASVPSPLSGSVRLIAPFDNKEYADVYLFMDTTTVVGVFVLEAPSISEKVIKVGIKVFVGCIRYSLELLLVETPLKTAARLYAYSVKVLRRWLSSWSPARGIIENGT